MRARARGGVVGGAGGEGETGRRPRPTIALPSLSFQTASPAALASTKTALEAWLADPANASAASAAAADPALTDDQRAAVAPLVSAFAVHAAPPAAAPLRAALNEAEAALAAARGGMRLGWTSEDGDFKEASAVQLRTLLRTAPDEATRRAAYEGLRSVGPFVAERFCDIVKMRNRLARAAGDNVDFYDYKVKAAEGMSKDELFAILDGLEAATRPLAERARAALVAAKGEAAWAPWNRPAALTGVRKREWKREW